MQHTSSPLSLYHVSWQVWMAKNSARACCHFHALEWHELESQYVLPSDLLIGNRLI